MENTQPPQYSDAERLAQLLKQLTPEEFRELQNSYRQTPDQTIGTYMHALALNEQSRFGDQLAEIVDDGLHSFVYRRDTNHNEELIGEEMPPSEQEKAA